MKVIRDGREREGKGRRATRSRGRKSPLGKTATLVVITLIGLLSILPVFWIVLTAFKPYIVLNSETPQIIFAPTLDHFVRLFTASHQPIIRYFLNSVITSVVSTLISLFLAVLSAYSLARLRPRGYKKIGFLILSMRMIPPISLIVPFYLLATRIGLLDTRFILIVAYTGLDIPFATWLLQGFLLDLPKELEEAARLDGCTYLGAFFRVILPLAGPGLAAAAIFSFILAWNDLTTALVLAPFKATTLTVLAANIHSDTGVLWGRLGSTTTIVMVPAILFTVFSSKWLSKGMVVTGGMK